MRHISFKALWAIIVLGLGGAMVLSMALLSLVAGDYVMTAAIVFIPGCILASAFLAPIILYQLALRRFVRCNPMVVQPEVEVVNHYYFEDGTVLTERVHKED